jgi:hypothetical protein
MAAGNRRKIKLNARGGNLTSADSAPLRASGFRLASLERSSAQALKRLCVNLWEALQDLVREALW